MDLQNKETRTDVKALMRAENEGMLNEEQDDNLADKFKSLNTENQYNAPEKENTMSAKEKMEETKDDVKQSAEQAYSELSDSVKEVQNSLAKKAKEGANVVCKYVSDNPFKAVGISAGLGFLIGYLIKK